MLILKLIGRLFKILHSDISPAQIAGGVAFGAIIGLTPLFSLHNLFVLFLICIIRVNVSSVIFSAIVFGLLSYIIAPLSNQLGYFLLVNAEFLKPLWTWLYNLPIVPWTNFNNTLLMGGLALSIVLFIPNLIWARKGVVAYRATLKPKLENTKLIKAIKASSLYIWYRRFAGVGEIITK